MGCVSHIEVDTDIAGVGVLIAFLLSSLLTCGAILWGYLTDSLPLSTTSAVDEAIVLWLRKSRKTAPAHQNLLTREQRTQALTRFILALSDQQLVTGLALMISAFANTANITIFDMKLVDTFAWFSATTHLAALAVLQDYMYIHSSVRSFRVIGVFIFLIMFGIIQCFLALTGNLRPGYEVNGLQCAFRHPCPAPSTYIRAVSLALITYGSISNLKKLYRKPSNQSIIWRPKFVNSSNFDLLCSIKHLNVDDARRKLPRVEEEMQMWLLSSSDLRQSFIQSFFIYHNSFLSKVPQFLLALSLALSRTFSLIGYQRAWSSPDIRRTSFGQVAALGLLILPGLAAVEVYNACSSSSTT
ncbi:hypothetical protein BS50DRAFT_620884 [Corynespora cassiicola Philippines]|uniref:Uncharacterized protein n=1 Tax=Corynespora cassiicola Philippines TaxID=1448308 RepID=A0A2T2NML0_CORCC|nr:hypothetical protein BS50DRAFT_620884 [Corynespora cassiicola Philippines]